MNGKGMPNLQADAFDAVKNADGRHQNVQISGLTPPLTPPPNNTTHKMLFILYFSISSFLLANKRRLAYCQFL
jgi:hypothetical protein